MSPVQIYLFLCIGPCLAGAVVRLVLCRHPKGYRITVLVALLAAVACLASWLLPTYGSELSAILRTHALCLLGGCAAVERCCI